VGDLFPPPKEFFMNRKQRRLLKKMMRKEHKKTAGTNKFEKGFCYENAYYWLGQHPELHKNAYIVHGMTTRMLPGKRAGHAWIEMVGNIKAHAVDTGRVKMTNRVVLDPTYHPDHWIDLDTYYEKLGIEYKTCYTFAEAFFHVDKIGHTGPWEGEEMIADADYHSEIAVKNGQRAFIA
jgi:hypothetical protein